MFSRMLKNILCLFIVSGMLFLSCVDIAFSKTNTARKTKTSTVKKTGSTATKKTNSISTATRSATTKRAGTVSSSKRSLSTASRTTSKKVVLSAEAMDIKAEQKTCRDAYVSCMDAQIKDMIDKYTYLYDDEAVQAYLDTGEPFRCLFYDIKNSKLPENMQVISSCREILNEATITSFNLAQTDMNTLATQYALYIKNPTCSASGVAELPVNSTAKTGICSTCEKYKTLNSFLSSHSTLNTAWKNYQSLCKEKYLVNANKNVEKITEANADYKNFVYENCSARDVNDLYFSYNYYCDLRTSTLKNAIGVKTNYCKLSSEEENTSGLTGDEKVRAEIANVFGTTSSSEYYKEALNRLDAGELKMVNFKDSNFYKYNIEILGLETLQSYDISSLLNTYTKCDSGYKYNATISACQLYNSETASYYDAGLSQATFISPTSSTSGSCPLSDDVYDTVTKKCARCPTGYMWNVNVRRCQDTTKETVSGKQTIVVAQQENELDARSIYTDLGINRDSSLFSINVVPPLGSGLVFPSSLFNKATTYCFDGKLKNTLGLSSSLKKVYATFNKNKEILAACKENYKDDLERYYLAGYWPKEDVEPSSDGTYNTDTDYEEKDFMSAKKACDMYEQNLISVRNNNYAKFDTQIKNYLEDALAVITKNKIKDTTTIANIATTLQKDDAQRTLNDIKAQSERETARLENQLSLLQLEDEAQTKQYEQNLAYLESQKKLKEDISSNYSSAMINACSTLGASLIDEFKKSGSVSSSALASKLNNLLVKVDATGDIKAYGSAGYDSLDASLYPEISCFDVEGFYGSGGYNNMMSALSDYLNSKSVKSSLINSYTSAGDGSGTFSSAGLYKVEVAGAGGGGAGGNYCNGVWGGDGADGGDGDLVINYIYLSKSSDYNYTVGAGGDKGCGSGCDKRGSYGKKGGTSSFSVGTYKINALGGDGAISATSGYGSDSKNGKDGADAGNGKGGSGGDGENGNHCGDSGSTGWIKVYLVGG